MRAARSPFYLLLLTALLGAACCGRGDLTSDNAGPDDENYRHGKELERLGQNQEALAAFLKVIDQRGADAPEAYIEAGLLYQQQVKDPLAAIYYYRKFLQLRPNSPQADLVKQRIDAATREFARTLPGLPLENNQLGPADQGDAIDRLQRENTLLREQLSAARSGLPPGPAASPSPISPVSPLNGLWPPAALPADPSPVIRASPPSTVPQPAAATSPAAAGRKHVVAAGDTLSSIAQKYYGNRNKYHDIYEANRDVMKNENVLPRIGTELKIP